MESDSDQFESADENFESDTDEKLAKHKKQLHHAAELPEIRNIVIKEEIALEQPNTTSAALITNVTETPKKPETATQENENNANVIRQKPRTIERRDRHRTKESKNKLGVKLGTKINHSNTDWEKFEQLDNENKLEEPPLVSEEKDNEYKCWSPPSAKAPKSDFEKSGLTPEEYAEKKKHEYGIPPKRVVCWEGNVNWNPPGILDPHVDPKLYSEKSELNPDNWDHEADYMELPKEIEEPHIEEKEQTGWGAWGNWGVSTLLSSASLGVTTITNSVSQGITTVLESGIGAPDPEELARIHRQQQETPENQKTSEQVQTSPDNNSSNNSQRFGLGNFVSGVSHITKLVESTGTKVLSGGLDTLETIGKKTMEVLQDGDPGLKKKRAFLKIEQDRPHLSQILREAKEKAEEENKMLEERHIAKKPNYETIFDDFQGLVHLEALEMLSKQCDIKLETLMASFTGTKLADVQETMAQIKDFCELPEDEEDPATIEISLVRERVECALAELKIPITYEHFYASWLEIDNWLLTKPENEQEVHQKAIESLAQLTAIAVEQFHKAGELLLVKEHRSTVDEADSLVQLTITLTAVIGVVAGKFSERLNVIEVENINDLITNIFLEAANSSTYIQDALNLMIPVLQVGVNISL